MSVGILWRMGRDREGAMIKKDVRRLNREHEMRQRAALSAETHEREQSRPLAKGGAPSDAVSGKRG